MTKTLLTDRSTQSTLQEALLASVPFPMVLLEANDHIGFANPAAELFFDVSSSLMKRQILKSLIAPDSAVHGLIDHARRRGVAASEYGVEVLLPKIGSRIVDASVVPVIDVPGSVLLVLQERSIAKKMDQHFNQIHLGNSVSSMAAILAHEIKNPLAGIRGAAQLIEQNASDSDRSLTRLICDETDRIRDLVDRTEIFTDHRRVDSKPVNIHEVLDHVKRLATSSFAQSIQFHEFYDPSLPPVAGDRDRLIQVYLNLVKNAADALHEQRDAEITLQTSFKAGVHLAVGRTKGRLSLPLEISVRDNGPGVPELVRQSLFEPFVTSKPKGQGLGLAIVAKIISDHGGTIECESEPRRTSFRTRLPVFRQEQERTQ